MMLRQNSLPSSTEADLSFASDHGEKELSCDKHPKSGHERAVPVMARKNSCGSCSTNFPSSSSQQSTVATMYENSTPTFVYQRRKQQRVSAAVFPAQISTKAKPSGNCLSVISSETPSVAAKEHVEIESRAVRAPVLLPVECTGRALISKSASISGCSLGEEVGSVEDPKHDMLRIVDVCCVNDSCSSSKSNMVLCAAALKTEVDDTGECSSSDAFIKDLQDDISKKDVCISILKGLGLHKGVWPINNRASSEVLGIDSDCSCWRSCKVCDQSDITLKMLICDQCEESFHVSCCYPRLKKIPHDEWFCHSCLKKRRKILKESTSSSEMSRCRNATSKGVLGPIAVMLEDTEPYTTNVRIGPEFQAEVPDWSGPVSKYVLSVILILILFVLDPFLFSS